MIVKEATKKYVDGSKWVIELTIYEAARLLDPKDTVAREQLFNVVDRKYNPQNYDIVNGFQVPKHKIKIVDSIVDSTDNPDADEQDTDSTNELDGVPADEVEKDDSVIEEPKQFKRFVQKKRGRGRPKKK